MKSKIIDLMECLVAYGTFICLLVAMRQLVILVISFLMESFAAELAYKRLVISVYTGMSIQRGTPVKRFTARLTLVRFFSGMYDLVPAKSTRLTKSFTAYLAYEWPSSCVYGHVPGKIVMRIENFTALGTCESLLLVRTV